MRRSSKAKPDDSPPVEESVPAATEQGRRGTRDTNDLIRELKFEKRCRVVIEEPRRPCRCLPDPSNRALPRMTYDDLDCEHYDEPALDVRRPSLQPEGGYGEDLGRRPSQARASLTEDRPIGAPGRRAALVRAEEEGNVRGQGRKVSLREEGQRRGSREDPGRKASLAKVDETLDTGRKASLRVDDRRGSQDNSGAGQGGSLGEGLSGTQGRRYFGRRFPSGRRVSLLLDEDFEADSDEDFSVKRKPTAAGQFDGKALDPRTGKIYYYNTETGERKWADPSENKGWELRTGYTKNAPNRNGLL